METMISTAIEVNQVLDDWTEEQLDNLVLSHPRLGPMTVRETLMFTILHAGHHFRSIDPTIVPQQFLIKAETSNS